MDRLPEHKSRLQYGRNLLRQFVITDFKLRYHGSILGYIWSWLRPLLYFSILYIVFVRFLKVGVDTPYPAVYLLLGLVVWLFFTEATTNGLNAIVIRGQLIRKINFPKDIILLAVLAGAGINFGLNLVIIGALAIMHGVTFGLTGLLGFLLVLEFLLFVFGIMAILSTLYVEYRDIAPFWEFFLQVMFYGTPILYSPGLLPKSFAQFTMLNPLAQIIQDFRYLLISDKTITIDHVFPGVTMVRLIPIGIALVIFILGVFFFQRRAGTFAERI